MAKMNGRTNLELSKAVECLTWVTPKPAARMEEDGAIADCADSG
jgi:hypothetical protein